jgi:preprotein translocase subunit SecY
VKINKEIRDIILKRLLVTLGVILSSRNISSGSRYHSDLAFYIQSHSVTRSLVSTFSGDDTFVIGLFTLNIFPYASILVQLILGFSQNLPN